MLALGLLLCLLSAEMVPAEKEVPALSAPDFNIYHKKAQVLATVDRLASQNPSSFKVEDVLVQEGEYASTLKVVTVEPSGLTDAHEDKLRLLLDFGEHGRELVTVEVALRLLELLADPTKLEELAAKRGGSPGKLQALLERSVFKIIPMENVHGREIVENGTLCERKNGRGVDSNRNWPVHWGFREHDYDPSEEYPGTSPFSEPEVQILNTLATSFKPHVWMNMHSGMEALFMPYDHVAAVPIDSPGRLAYRLLDRLNALKCGSRCATGSGGKSVGYLAHGTATDYMHDVVGVPFSFTWEIYGDMSASFQDCFRMFNPLTAGHLEEVVENWADAVLAMLELLPAGLEDAKPANSLLPRKLFPSSLLSVLQDDKISNWTATDVAAGLRRQRLGEVCSVVAEVERSLGITHQPGHWSHLAGLPATAWVLLLVLVVATLGLLLARGVISELAGRGRGRMSRRRHQSTL